MRGGDVSERRCGVLPLGRMRHGLRLRVRDCVRALSRSSTARIRSGPSEMLAQNASRLLFAGSLSLAPRLIPGGPPVC